MKSNYITLKEDKYYLNEHQYFYINKEEIKKGLKDIKFPAIIMDTEFFNKSHDRSGIKHPLYNEKNKDLVYVLQYSFAKNFKEIYERKNIKAIKSMTIKHIYKDEKYNFYEQYNAMVKSFLNMCISKNIKTLVFAGGANDVKIMKTWINNNKKILNNKKSDLFILNPENKEYDVNSFDIYSVMEKAFSVSNYNADGSEFYKKDLLKKGNVGLDTIQLPSLKKFFDWMGPAYTDGKFDEEEDIYDLCVKSCNFYSNKSMHYKDFLLWNAAVKKSKMHCYNDVLKLLYLIKFMYAFINFTNEENNYLK